MFYWQSMLLFSLKYSINIKWLLKCDAALIIYVGIILVGDFFKSWKHMVMVYWEWLLLKYCLDLVGVLLWESVKEQGL